MINFEVDMSVDYQKLGCAEPKQAPKLTTYILDEAYLGDTAWKDRPAVIVCPGGGYSFVSPREGEPIAMGYCAAGFHAFVLDYSVAPTGWPAACCELSKAVAYVRSIAAEHHIDKDRIVVCGFSAGGHLAASIGVHYDKEVVREFSGVTGLENRPDGVILGYPVIIDQADKTHKGTMDNFVAGRESALPYFSLDRHVTENTPKTFLWHTFADPGVPVDNSMRFAQALLEHGVAYELHIYPEGGHGLSLANRITHGSPQNEPLAAEGWFKQSVDWLNRL